MAAAFVGGCATEGDIGSTPPADAPVALTDEARRVLEQQLDKQWLLVSGTVGDAVLEPDDAEPVTFAAYKVDGVLHLGGRSCNGFGMPTEGEFAGEVSSSAMACEGGSLMQYEHTVMGALPRIADATVEGDTLTLRGEQLELILTAATDADAPASASRVDLAMLQDVVWELRSGTVDSRTVALPLDQPVWITFERSDDSYELTVRACNLLSGELLDWPDRFRVSPVGPPVADCDHPDLKATEEALISALPRLDHIAGGSDDIVLTGPGVDLELVAVARPAPADG